MEGGIWAILFGLVLAFAGLAPFPPAAATEAFVSVVPTASALFILLVASIILVLAYGLWGIVFERYVDKDRRLQSLSRLERGLLHSLVPWLVLGIVLFPMTGYSIFGQSLASPGMVWAFPFTLLISQLAYGVVVAGGLKNSRRLFAIGNFKVGDLRKGISAGISALLFVFILRLAGLAPFPPEAATEAFIGIVPASIEEPAVQQLGDYAGLLTLLAASIILVVVYGFWGIIFEKYVDKDKRLNRLSKLERALLHSTVFWLVLGLVFFPITGNSIFGVASAFGSPFVIWLFPFSLLVSQLLYGFQLTWGPKISLQQEVTVASPGTEKPGWEERLVSRRAFIEKSVLLGSAAILALASAGSLISSLAQSALQGSGGTPIDLAGAPAIFSDPRLAGLVDSEVTSNATFYRVAIDLFDPSVSSSYWSLPLFGAIANPKTYSLSEIQALPSVDEYDTFLCVSNVVNGNLVGNAKWTGVRIMDLLADAGGLLASAQYIVFYSVDGYSVGLPVSKATRPDSILAYRMNDVTLPVKHGYPLRAVIPGLYGMMSAKWINGIKIIDSPYSGYWQTRGWTSDATVNTQSFIMVPSDGSSISLSQNKGSVLLGGVAYAGDRGVSIVEVSVDGGSTWTPATLKNPLSNLTWRLWAYDWHPAANGSYNVYVTATDGSGQTQTSAASDTYPNGATGYAMITLNVVS